jgi:hypothetical protein
MRFPLRESGSALPIRVDGLWQLGAARFVATEDESETVCRCRVVFSVRAMRYDARAKEH